MQKPHLRFAQIWNMNFGFFGIQFGWGLQMANMSAIYEYLGASPDQIPMLWLAAPLTGLIVQPIIGNLSDHTWGRLGRRRPYFLVGAILSSAALLVMPNVKALWMAAGLLWMLDASINISMEPFRAFVADMLPEEQRTQGFAMQSLFIGLGAVIASALPWLLTHWGVSGVSVAGQAIPTHGQAFLHPWRGCVSGRGTVDHHHYQRVSARARTRAKPAQAHSTAAEILSAIREMPRTMRQLAWVQLCTWLGLFCMWLYFPVAVAHQVFGANDHAIPALFRGSGMGRPVLWHVLGGLLRLLFRAGTHGAGAFAAQNAWHLPGGRRVGPAFGSCDPQQICVAALHDGRGNSLGQHPLHALCDAGRFTARESRGALHGDLQLLYSDAGDCGIAGIRVGHEPPAGQQSRWRRWSAEAYSCCWQRCWRSGSAIRRWNLGNTGCMARIILGWINAFLAKKPGLVKNSTSASSHRTSHYDAKRSAPSNFAR